MPSITPLLMNFLHPDVQASEADRAFAAEAFSHPLLFGPLAPLFENRPSALDFTDVVAGLDAFEVRSSLYMPASLDLPMETPPGADWIALGMPVFSGAELRAFVGDWHLADPERFLESYAVTTWWEALRTEDGRWTLVPQDARPGVGVAVPTIASYQDTLVFDRLDLRLIGDQADDDESPCQLVGAKKRPNQPYSGMCLALACGRDCVEQTGTTSDGNRVVLACGC